MIGPGQHCGEYQEHATNGERKKKRICWHLETPMLKAAWGQTPAHGLMWIKFGMSVSSKAVEILKDARSG
jgi:hypothetical protein